MWWDRRLTRTKFLPLFMQRRCPARSRKVWGHGTVSRSDGLCKIQGTVWRKLGAVRTLRSASFKHKNNALRLCCQQPKENFGELYNHIRFYLWKRKIPPTQRSDDFVGWSKRQNESGVLRGGKFFRGLFLTEVVGLTVITNHFLWLCSKWTRPHLVDEFEPIHKINGIYKKNTTACRMRQEGFEKFIEVKQEKYNTSCSFRKKIRYVNQNKPHFLSAVDLSIAGSNRMLHFWPLSNNRCKKMQGKNPSDG